MATETLEIDLTGTTITVTAKPLNSKAYAPFGDVISNPKPNLHPSAVYTLSSPPIPGTMTMANQGTAIKYQNITRMLNLYSQAPSGRTGEAVVNMFVCAARHVDHSESDTTTHMTTFAVSVLERHPFTTQTFIPLCRDPERRYLVIVAPSLPPSRADEHLPVPPDGLPGRGLPDLSRLQAFWASSSQGVTYGAGTWHAPMAVLGAPGTSIDFVVVQFANRVTIEDCQEVFLKTGSSSSSSSSGVGESQGRVEIKVPLQGQSSKL